MKTTILYPLRKISAGLLVLLLVCFALLAVAQPTDNPYRTFKGNNLPFPHWTDSIKWGNVVNIKRFENLIVTLPQGNNTFLQDWCPAYNAARDSANRLGGGVVYFPKLPQSSGGEDSAYYFSCNLNLVSGVVVRGETPPANASDARYPSFSPPTFFQFPIYTYDPTIPTGTPNAPYFKQITTTDTICNNTGIVNVDFNCASISGSPKFYPSQTTGPTGSVVAVNWARQGMRNWIVFGTRSNNAAYPDPTIPTGNIAAYNRWPYRFSANILIFVDENAVVVNNRCNDLLNNNNPNRIISSRDFGMTNYGISGYPGGGYPPPSEAIFDYNAHYGIVVNRLKKVSNGVAPLGFVDYSTPAIEPSLFPKGIEITNNWIFKKARVGIQAAGLGAIIADNVIRDDSNKVTKIDASGRSFLTNRVVTFENRGIDISGWNNRIENNDIEVYRTQLASIGPNSYSADGEGWYAQGPGGSNPRGHIFRGNKTKSNTKGLVDALNSGQGKGFNGLYNTNEIIDVLIENNDNGCIPVFLSGNTGTAGVLSNVIVRNNTNVRAIKMLGTAGGQQNYCFNNTLGTCSTVPGLTASIDYSCCTVSLNPDAALAGTNTNTGLTPNACTPCNIANPCQDPTAPAIRLKVPSADVFVRQSTTDTLLTAIIEQRANCNIDSVYFFKDLTNLGPANIVDSVATFQFFLPLRPFDVLVSASLLIPGSSPTQFSVSNAYHLIGKTPNGVSVNIAHQQINVYPNPATSDLFIKLSDANLAHSATVIISDMFGRQVKTIETPIDSELGTSTNISVAEIPSGVYNLTIRSGNTTVVKRFVKQ